MDDTDRYGLIDIARALTPNQDEAEVKRTRLRLAQWRRRGKLPTPDGYWSSRPYWYPATIEPWIKEQADAPVDSGPPPKEP
jgi:hypothetical protein